MADVGEQAVKRVPLTNRRKDVVRKGVYAHAFKECHELAGLFADCVAGRMLSVVWACRPENHAMNECLHQYTNKVKMDKAYSDEEDRLAVKRAAEKSAAREKRAAS